MPPKRRTNNKKKNKNKGQFGHGRDRRQTNSNQGSNAGAGAASNATIDLKGKVPEFWENLKRGKLHQAFPTVYSRYKKATTRFFEYMEKVCPSEMGKGKSTNSLMAASDVLANTGHIMDRSILKDLKLAICMRTKVAKSVYGGGDAGHKYFLKVLTYCWYVLNSLPKTAKKEKSDVGTSMEDTANPFEALMEEDEDEDEEEIAMDDEEEKMFPSTPVERPSSLSGSEPLSLDELIRSDEWNDIILFLLSLDEIMGVVVEQYRTVIKNFGYYQRCGIPLNAITKELMEAAVATNMAIQQAQQLEMDLITQYEHLTTSYRVLATLVPPEITEQLTATVREHGMKKGCTEKDISVYVGDCLESHFRHPSDPCNRKEEIVIDFCNEWQVDLVGVKEFQQTFEVLQQYVDIEVPVGAEKAQFQREVRCQLPDSHSWIQNMPYIGGDRAIHHTLRLLQIFRHVIHRTKRVIEPVRGYFGKSPWAAKRSPSKKLRDLDELFMTDILPKWVIMCRKGIIGLDPELPFENELCPLFVLMRKYVQEPERPVTWSITFAVHAMLTAILQIEPIFENTIQVSKQVFGNYVGQLEWAQELATKNTESLGSPTSVEQKSWWTNMMSVSFLENLGLPVFGDRTLWNPLCAGTIFSYLSYFGNLEAGCAMIDCQAQLRITLHLFHALLVTGILHKGEVPLLDILYEGFRNCKAIWGGRSLPQKGEFVQRFWISFGYDLPNSRRMSDDAEQIIREKQKSFSSNSNRQHSRKDTRKIIPVEASDVFKSYRRICNRDFHDVVDKYHTPEQRRKSKNTDFYRLMVNTNDTLDAIEDEQTLMSLNFPSCSVFIEQFVNSLGRDLQWEPILKAWAPRMGNDQRQVFALIFAQYLLGALDFADDPFRYNFMDVPLGQASSHFMTVFFSKINRSKLIWYQSTSSTPDDRKTATSFQGVQSI